MNVGNDYLVYVCDLPTMEKIGKMDVFCTRQDWYHEKNTGDIIGYIRNEEIDPKTPHGIAYNDGQSWMEQRKFAMRHLKEFGFGKSSMESLVADEAKELIADMKTKIKANNELQMVGQFNLTIINSLWNIITGKRLDLQNPADQKRMDGLNEFMAQFSTAGIIQVLVFKLPLWLAKKIPAIEGMRDLHGNLFSWFWNEYKEHEDTYDEDNHRDFTDSYIAERRKADNGNIIESSFYGNRGKFNYALTLHDFFIAGSETTSTTLSFAVLSMLHDPEPWKKARAELDEVVGRTRLPTLDDRPNLIYFEALISELMRRANVAPFAVLHSVHVDTNLNQYKVPAHSKIVFAITEVLNDPKYFPEPEKFKPERFLNHVDGKMIYKAHPALVPFGVGKRKCMGALLAQTEIFIFLSALIHTFNFEPTIEGFPGLDDCIISITKVAKPFKAKVSIRN